MEALHRNEAVIRNQTPLDKRVMFRVNNSRQHGFDAVSKTFSNQFHSDVAEAYGPKVSGGTRGLGLWNEADESFVQGLRIFPIVENVKDKAFDIFSNNVPILVFIRAGILSRPRALRGAI